MWLNGPNGVGKTQVAFDIQRRLPGCFVSDPELLGYALRKMMPKDLRVDFREIPLWARGVSELPSTVSPCCCAPSQLFPELTDTRLVHVWGTFEYHIEVGRITWVLAGILTQRPEQRLVMYTVRRTFDLGDD